ncbi:MAG TPA: hypothetical protein VHW01_24160, partial [Polyangiaceae bacterium]|nr:hypothetical protein [Polyangiaceae bacterium]
AKNPTRISNPFADGALRRLERRTVPAGIHARQASPAVPCWLRAAGRRATSALRAADPHYP